jgi:hypothetical protein
MKWLAIFSLGFVTLGCSDHMISKVQPNEQDILVHPEHINFGNLVSGEESGQDTFAVINTGDHELTILTPVLVSGTDRFSFLAEGDGYVIEEGELIEFEVGYIPETFESNGAYIEIESDDPDEPMVKVTLEGYGDAPVMVVEPDDFDYGDISIGCDNEERVTIRNEGNLDLVIDSITQMVTQPVDILMEMGSLPDPPWTLVPGQEIDFLVSYIPTDVGYDESQITVAGNDPVLPEVDVIQYGDGDVEQWHHQQHFQEEIPILDILWVVDNSGSMNPHQTNLSTNIGSFMSAFAATGADYNMSVITTDNWMFSSIVTPYSADPEGEIASLVVTGIMGSGMEKGIEMAYNSLSSSSAAGPGGSFFREDARLVVIFVSDEPDYSGGGWASYLSFFDSLKSPGEFIPYGVIGDPPSGCSTYPSAQYGAGYWDLIDNYGGSWYSICASDWGVQLQDLAGEVTGRRSFVLEESDPIVGTIEVTVNGQVTTDWEYDEATNSIIFAEGHVPEEGQTIDIDYAVWGCEGR